MTFWLLLQLSKASIEILLLPDWIPKLIRLMMVTGFVPTLILAWGFRLTPGGIKLENEVVRNEPATKKTGHELEYLIIISFGLSFGLYIADARFNQKTAAYEAATAAASKPQPAVHQDYSMAGVNKNSIAVLPFDNRSADAGDRYFADGIHEDVLTQLSKINAFSVISRTSVTEYRDVTKNLRQIAHELSVANVLEGSVQRAGDRVRINVQLIDALSDDHLWAEIYDRELTASNLFEIQSEIAQAVARALKATLSDSELARVAAIPTDNVAAWVLFQLSNITAVNFGAPSWVTIIIAALLLVGFVLTIFYAWSMAAPADAIEQDSADGSRVSVPQQPNLKLDYITVALFAVVVGMMAMQQLMPVIPKAEISKELTPPGAAPASAVEIIEKQILIGVLRSTPAT